MLRRLLAATLLLATPGVASAQQGEPAVAAAPRGGPERVPPLGRAIALARERAASVVAARGQLGVARAAHVGARLSSLQNPYFEILAQRGTSGTQDLAISGTAWLPLEVSGQRDRRIAEADALVAWQTESVEAARAAAAADALRAYGNVSTAQARVKTLMDALSASRDEARIHKERVDAKDSTMSDLTLAQVEVARNAVALGEAKSDLARALSELARATGAPAYTAGDDLELRPPPPRLQDESGAERTAERSPLVTPLAREAEVHARVRDRFDREGSPPVSLMVTAGRGDLGETRYGAGVAFTWAATRRNQGEQARADSERARVLSEASARKQAIAAALRGIVAERAVIAETMDELSALGMPAAEASVSAAQALYKAGKGELLRVFSARRDLVQLRVRLIELASREWSLAADAAALTGDAP